jgi:hypothetical protein
MQTDRWIKWVIRAFAVLALAYSSLLAFFAAIPFSPLPDRSDYTKVMMLGWIIFLIGVVLAVMTYRLLIWPLIAYDLFALYLVRINWGDLGDLRGAMIFAFWILVAVAVNTLYFVAWKRGVARWF